MILRELGGKTHMIVFISYLGAVNGPVIEGGKS